MAPSSVYFGSAAFEPAWKIERIPVRFDLEDMTPVHSGSIARQHEAPFDTPGPLGGLG